MDEAYKKLLIELWGVRALDETSMKLIKESFNQGLDEFNDLLTEKIFDSIFSGEGPATQLDVEKILNETLIMRLQFAMTIVAERLDHIGKGN